MVYEGEQQGAEVIAKKLIGTAVKKVFDATFPAPDSGRPTQRRRQELEEALEEETGSGARRRAPQPPERVNPLYEPIVEYFAAGNRVTISDDTPFSEHLAALDAVPGLRHAVEEHTAPSTPEELAVGMELVLEGLTQHLKIAREDLDSRVSYTEMLKFNLVRSRPN
jgi:magnesium chelatase subunit I